MADALQAAKLLKAQITFFLRPNHSAYYPDFLSAFLFRPVVPMLTAALLVMCAIKRTTLSLAVLLWVLVYLYLVAKRPHDTSMASFAISLGFMLAILALRFKRSIAVLGAVVAVACAGAALQGFHEIRRFATVRTDTEAKRESIWRADSFYSASGPVVWFIPSNYWNATYGPQGFAYNGGLAIRPKERRQVLGRLFPGADVALLLEEIHISGAEVVYWTRPPGSDPGPLFEALRGARIVEQPGEIAGPVWILGKAFLHE